MGGIFTASSSLHPSPLRDIILDKKFIFLLRFGVQEPQLIAHLYTLVAHQVRKGLLGISIPG